MAPSRGLLFGAIRFHTGLRRGYSTFTETVSNPKNRVQSYISRSRDPYLNLSIEHYLLQNSPPDSTVLFLYTNRPCIVIGRNQNPWLEVNLALLKTIKEGSDRDTEPPGIGNVDLVRRRSGGGTVFHDEGNVNWSIICPPAAFTRDKHAEMVVRALRKQGIERARVNERHDIVLDQGSRASTAVESTDTHRTPYMVDDLSGPRPLKISGSAYKLTRTRSLHHGTCLLTSPNLNIIPQYLHSPAKPFIKARGVESVSSPVGNVGLDPRDFETGVQQEFESMYNTGKEAIIIVGEEQLDIPAISKGYAELKTPDWMYCQTPQFVLSSAPVDDIDTLKGATPPTSLPGPVSITAKHGEITEITTGADAPPDIVDELNQIPKVKIHELGKALKERPASKKEGPATRWLLSMLPAPT